MLSLHPRVFCLFSSLCHTCRTFLNPPGHVCTYISVPPLLFQQKATILPQLHSATTKPDIIPEFAGTMLFLVTKAFSLFKSVVRGTSIVINTWVEILCAVIYFNIIIFWRFVVWFLSLITLPARALAALHRDKQLQAQLCDLQDRLDSLAWDRKELQEHIRVALEEQEMMEMMLGELEEEHDEAIHKITLLETELQDLKDENHRLKEVHGKSQWDTDSQVGAGYGYGYGYGYGQKHNKDGISPWKSDHYKVTDILLHKDAFNDVNKGKFDAHESAKNDLVRQFINGSVCLDNIFGQRREVAVSQSLFSAMLSLLVGMVIWEAQEPCMPLVTALFMVVGMSLKSVVQFFSTIKNKPASDAVALLSLNWFILGTLVYPTLPRVAHISAPFFNKSFGGLSLSFLVS
ncbi:hypothetical protein L1987_41435 [Smallanthus sonchifolius]|uniref:Uncharacterized protein n=1 Tax=Smallanthus sonchifolius TaxID=185202 RepID=A0ACB9GUJ4_9ASTR|nr:hypothetical protein L1987_41435 [Smallanthus sonchifolius]